MKRSPVLQYLVIVLVSTLLAIVLAEAYLSHRASSRLTLPFYNELYPYVMFRPHASTTYKTGDTHQMSHHTRRIVQYTNADGFRVASPGYEMPKQKPAGQLRVAFLGASAVQLGSTFETTLPGSMKTFLQNRFPGRDIEVINAAIQSCVSRQSIAHLVFTVADYSPDIVVLYDGVNDIGLPLTYESRPNFPYNFQTMTEAWDAYREQHQVPLWRLMLDRSRLFAALKTRWTGDAGATTATTVALGLNKAPNAVTAQFVIENPEFVREHIAAYLTNWRQFIELSKAFGYKPICVLQPTGGLEPGYALPLTMRDAHHGLTEENALRWMEAFSLLYQEADRQIEDLRAEYPEAVFLNLRDYLSPAKDYYWDLVHVYDETNMKLAERIYQDMGDFVSGAADEAAAYAPAGRR